jgi:hypothetical protein
MPPVSLAPHILVVSVAGTIVLVAACAIGAYPPAKTAVPAKTVAALNDRLIYPLLFPCAASRPSLLTRLTSASRTGIATT